MKCNHDALSVRPTLVIEAHWAAGVRIRCSVCGETAGVRSKSGRVYRETRQADPTFVGLEKP